MLVVEEIECGTVEEFVSNLRPSNPQWSPRQIWIFRGQADANWPLTPSAWRSDGQATLLSFLNARDTCCKEWLAYPLKPEHPNFQEWKDARSLMAEHYLLMKAEIEVILEFTKLSASLGYPIIDLVLDIDGSIGIPFPSTLESYPATYQHFQCEKPFLLWAGLAQHHGMPTRLLDWTRNGLKAAYFATVGAIEARTEKLSVWALRTDLGKPEKIKVLEYPAHRNENLKAQQGLFTLSRHADHFYREHQRWPSLVESLEAAPVTSSTPALKKFTLPDSLRGELVELLWREEISQAHLMPGYASIVSTLRGRWELGLS